MTAVAPRLRGYRILGTIASGASGTVFRAVQEQLSREVAVKVLAPGLFGAAETRSRFLREARLQARLSHPALLAVYDAGFAAGQPYLVTELVEGGTLRRRLDFEGRLALDETLRLGLALAQGLGSAHEAGIVHRDLKPENVLLTESGEIKLADFGLARELSAANSAGTARGMILGTPGYLAPEVIEGREAGPAADVYGLGVVLYEMAAGRRPFGAESLDLTFRAQLEGVASPLVELDLGIPAELDSLVGQCLQRDPSARPASALEVARRLEAIQEGSGKVPQTVTRPMRAASVVAPGGARDTVRAGPEGERVPRRSASWRALGALVACLLLAAGGAALWTSLGPRQPLGESDTEGRRPGAPTAGPLAQMPRFRVTTGLDRARVWFDKPLAEPARLGLRRVGEAAGELLDFPAGLEVGEVSKLRPGLRYRGELSTAAGTAPVDFGTLGSPRTTSVALLDGDLSSVGTALCSVSGRSLAVVWTRHRQRKEQLLMRESPDAGATWSYPALLPISSKDIESLAIQHLSPAEVVVGWREERGRQYMCKLARLSIRRMTLEETVDLGEQLGGPSIFPASDGGKDGLSLLLVGKGEVTERRLLPGSLLTTAPRRAFAPPSGEVDFASVELPGGHGQLFWDEPHGSGSNSFWWTHVRGDGTWSELVSLARASKFRMSRPASAASGSLVLVGFEMRGRVFLRISTDGGHQFGPLTEPLADERWRERPALAAAGGIFYLATVRQTHFAGPRAIDLHSSKDGRNWTLVASQHLLPALEQACRSVRVVAFPEHVVVLAADRQMGFLCVRLPAR